MHQVRNRASRAKTSRGGGGASESSAREKIIAAARELFAQCGFRDTTVRAIAKKAGVNGAAVNYYFSSKDSLYAEIFYRAFETSARPLEDLVRGVTDQESWKAALEAWFGFMLELFLLDTPERGLFRRLVAQERSAPTDYCRRLYYGVFLPVVDVFRALLRMALPDEPPETFRAKFVTIVGMCTCFMHRDPPWDEIEISPAMPREEWVRTLRDEIVASVCARYSFRVNPDAV